MSFGLDLEKTISKNPEDISSHNSEPDSVEMEENKIQINNIEIKPEKNKKLESAPVMTYKSWAEVDQIYDE